jgi:hypothetical protein
MTIEEQVACNKQPPAEWATIGLWLDLATRGLAEEAKARICQEYTAHFDEAVRVKAEEGFAGYYAECVVLLELGSPYKARRRLRATNLTASEAYFLRLTEGHPTDMTRFPRATAILNIGVLFFAVAALGLAIAPWIDMFGAGGHIILLSLACGSLPYAVAAILQWKRSPFARKVARLIACVQITLAAAVVAFGVEQTIWGLRPINIFDSSSSGFYWEVWLFAAVACHDAWWMWHLQKKLPDAIQRASQ